MNELMTNNATPDGAGKIATRPKLRPNRPLWRSTPHHFFVHVLSGVLLSALLALGACSGGSKNRAPRAEPGVFDSPSQNEGGGSSGPGSTTTRGGWSIVVESMGGVRAEQQAGQSIIGVREALGRGDISIRTSENGAAILVGNYSGPNDPRVATDLAEIRATQVQGRFPFAAAFLAPPLQFTDPGAVPELSLVSARQVFGTRAAYTLQVGVYESRDRQEAKRAAEEAAVRLRTEGLQAFYHHGPRRSSVTIGVFSENDLDSNLQPINPALIALKQRYPRNLLNGQFPIVERHMSGTQREQPSMLVRIPER